MQNSSSRIGLGTRNLRSRNAQGLREAIYLDAKIKCVAYFLPHFQQIVQSSGGVFMIQQSLLAVLFALAVAALACGRSGDPENEAPANISGTTNTVRSNADLETAVKAKFKTDEQLRSADLGVSANAAKKEITLSGSVESEALRSKAVDLARSVDSGVTVNDQIDVKPSGRTADNNPPSDKRAHG
jgi:osmotically-inducible protein OsmY